MQKRSTIAGLLAGLALLAAAPARADELRALFGGWSYDFEGSIDDRGTHYDFKDDLDLKPLRRRGFALEIDTPEGGWPDLTLTYTPMGAEGERIEEITFPLPATREIRTDADFDAHEVVARWPLNSSPLRLSAGIALQRLRGRVVIDDSEEAQQRYERYDEIFPQLHAQVRMAGRSLGLEAVAQGISYQGSRAIEFRALVEARFLSPLLVQFGWQEKRYEIELSDYALDARVSGAVLRFGVIYR